MSTSHLVRTASALSLVLSCSALAACGDSEGDDGAGAAASSGTNAGGGGGGPGASSSSTGVGPGSGGSGGEGPTCELPSNPGSGQMVDVDTLEATLVDPMGEPLANVLTQVCGLDLCINGESDGTGHSVVAVNQELKQPAFKYGDGLTVVRFAQPVEMPSGDLGELVTVRLPTSGVAMTVGSEATSGPVTLTFPADGAIEVDELIYDEPDKMLFRAAQIPADQAPPAVDPALDLELLFGVAPLETLFCPAAQVTVPNDAGWEPGTEVEFWAHGLDILQHVAPYGGWAKASDGKVSDDGMTVSTTPEGGFLVLTTFGVRRK